LGISLKTDGNGTINVKELKNLTYALGYFLGDDESLLVKAQLDRNNDGHVGLKEFTSWWRQSRKFDNLASMEG